MPPLASNWALPGFGAGATVLRQAAQNRPKRPPRIRRHAAILFWPAGLATTRLEGVMKHTVTQLLLAAALALGFATAAQAFTFEGAAPGDGAGAAKSYVDPVDKYEPKGGSVSNFDSGNRDQSEGLHFQFNGQPQSFDQKYNFNDYFNPNKR
jgi:hypothetical protein